MDEEAWLKMRIENREHVETLGRFGVESFRDEHGVRAKQLNSFWLYVDEEDHGYTKHAIQDGFWEAWITYWMDKNVPDNSCCLDIGANHGYYSMLLANKGCRVYAFEPQAKLVSLIEKSALINETDVTVVEAAVGKDAGRMSMMVPIHHGMNATISNNHSYAPDGYGTVDVDVVALDDFDDVPVDFIKVDAEGAEYLIWQGSKNFRKKNPNCLWLMEWRWDRFDNPEVFGQELLDEYTVTHVGYDGNESTIHSVDHLATRKHEDWMLVLRSK
jgi:FkbM family methyltransferase